MEQKNLKKNNNIFYKKKYLINNKSKNLKKFINKHYKFYLKNKYNTFYNKYDKNIGYIYKYNSFIRNKLKSLNVDFIFKNSFITKFINNLMKKGNKVLAEKLIYKSLQMLKLNLIKYDNSYFFKQQSIILGKNYNYLYIIYILTNIIKFIKIPFEIKNIRIGGKVYQVPFILNIEKQQNKAIKLIINLVEKNLNQNFKFFFVSEIEKLMLNRSVLNRHVLDYYKLVYDNRFYAHYRWY